MTPEHKAKISASQHARWNDPVKRSQCVKNIQRAAFSSWADPEKKAERMRKNAETRKRNTTCFAAPAVLFFEPPALNNDASGAQK